jgi:hypothetical protein
MVARGMPPYLSSIWNARSCRSACPGSPSASSGAVSIILSRGKSRPRGNPRRFAPFTPWTPAEGYTPQPTSTLDAQEGSAIT